MTYRLLFADNSATMHRVVAISLAREDVELMAARSGQEALAHSRQVLPDVALIDLGMADLNGYQVCAKLREDPRCEHLPILLMASAQHVLDPSRADQCGASGSIIKPFETQALVAALARARGVKPADEPQAEHHSLPSSAAFFPDTATAEPQKATDSLLDASLRPSFFGRAAATQQAPSEQLATIQSRKTDILPDTVDQSAHGLNLTDASNDFSVAPKRPFSALNAIPDELEQVDNRSGAARHGQVLPTYTPDGLAGAWLERDIASQTPSDTGHHAVSAQAQGAQPADAGYFPEMPSWDLPSDLATSHRQPFDEATNPAFAAPPSQVTQASAHEPLATPKMAQQNASSTALDREAIVHFIREEVARQLEEAMQHTVPAAAEAQVRRLMAQQSTTLFP